LGSKDYINYRLTGRYATDHSYASGFGAYSLKERNYIGDYLSIAGISRWILPDPVRSTEYIGNLCNEAAAELALTQCVRVYCGGVDNSCMALGALNIGEGRHYMSLGSSAWIAISSTTFLVDTTIRPFVFSHVLPDMYTSATSIFSAGSSLRWFRDTMAEVTVITGAHSDIDPYVLIDEAAKASPVGSRNVIFNPTLAGSPAASEYPHMKGAFLHLDLSISFPDIARAVLEGIAFELFDMYQKLQKLTKLSGNLVIVGGGSKSDFWMQMFADVFGIPVSRLNIDQDAAALGAAAIAAVGSGLWNNFDRLSTVIREIKIFMPDLYIHQMYQSYFETYLDARRKLGGV
jgi:xylulokinase